jgi:O-antigen/teichoic acid export membrane protein
VNFYNKISGLISKNIPPPLRKAIGQVLGAQFLLQLMGLGISVLLVRVLPKSEYAIYTVLMAVLGMLGIISSSGIMIGFKKIGGQIWNQKKALADLIKTTFSIRKYLILFAFLVVGTYTIIVFKKQQIPLYDSFFFIVALLFMVIPNASIGIYSEGLRLQKIYAPVQLQSIISQVIRIVGILIIFLFCKEYLTIKSVLIITVVGMWVSLFYLKKKQNSNLIIDDSPTVIPKVNNEYRSTLIKFIKLNWHNSLFFAFKDQISIFIIGVYGSKASLADLGAITRYSMVFLVIVALVTNILGPTFGRCNQKLRLKQITLLSMISYLFFFAVVIIMVMIFSDQLLWLLGSKYEGLNQELLLVFISSLLLLGVQIINALNNSKGWIKYSPFLEIPLGVIGIIVGIIVFDMTTVKGALYLSIVSMTIMLFMYSANFIYGYKNFEDETNLS